MTAVALGLLIGAALGLLGGGGSILTVPVFVYVLGFTPKEAIAMSLAVVGATSAFGTMTHWRAGRVNVRLGLLFGVIAMAGTYAGAVVARFLSGGVQLLLFAVVMAIAAVLMSRPRAVALAAGAPAATPLVQMGIAAVLVGVLTGVVGVGGGFLIVPALVVAAVPIGEAVGTSLLVITLNCAIGILGYLGQVPLAWGPIALVTAGTIPGITVGAHLHGGVSQEALRRGFAAFLVLMAAFILYQNAGIVLSAFARR